MPKKGFDIDKWLTWEKFHEISKSTGTISSALRDDPKYRKWYRDNVGDPVVILKRQGKYKRRKK